MRRFVHISLMVFYTLGILAPASAIVLDNEQIGIGANDMGFFTIGVPVPGVADTGCPENIKDLTCCNYCAGGGAGLGHVIFKIDGEYYSNDELMESEGAITLDLVHRTESILDLHLKTIWEAGDIKITQLLVPLGNYVRIQYTIVNTGTVPHEVGVLLNMDLKIGNSPLSDMARFQMPTGNIIDTTAILERGEVPLFWHSNDPGDSTFIARGVLGIPPNVKPDRLAIGEARFLTATLWDPDLLRLGERYEDSGIIYWWDPQSVDPGNIMEIITSYGWFFHYPCSDSSHYICNFIPDISGSRRFGFYGCKLLPNPFSITINPVNITTYTVDNVYATITFTDPILNLAEGEDASKPVLPTPIGAGFSGITYWVAEITDPPTAGDVYCRYSIEIISTFDSCASDSVECLVYDTCLFIDSMFIPASSYENPVAELVEPLYSTLTSDRNQHTIFNLTDLEGINTSTVLLKHTMGIDEFYFRVDDSILVFEEDSRIVFRPEYCAEVNYADGNRPMVQLINARDIHGCTLDETLTTRFLVDLTPPVCRGLYPDSDTLWDSLFTAWMNIYDNLGHVDTTSIELGINKLSDGLGTYTIFHDALYYQEDDIYVINDTLFIDPAAGGFHWDDGLVEICPVRCTDSPDYGTPLAIDEFAYCFSFTVNAHGPRAYSIQPNDGECTSNSEQPIIIKLVDGNGIIPSSIQLTIQGDTTILVELADTIIYWEPTEAWDDMEVVGIRLLSAEDSMGIPLDPHHTLDYSFLVDLTPPFLGDYRPTEGEVVGTVRPLLTIPIMDSGCGVDTASLFVRLEGEEWSLSHPAVWWESDEGIIYFNTTEAGLAFSAYDTVEVCVTASDSPTWGTPNTGGPYCWTFYIAAENPEAWFTTGNYLCDPEPEIKLIVTDSDGIDASTIFISVLKYSTMSTFDFTLADPELRYVPDTLTYLPTEALENGDSLQVCLTEAEDLFGYTLASPVCQKFFIDLDAPFFVDRYNIFADLTPGPIADTSVNIYIELGDSTGFIDETTIRLVVNGIEFTTESEALTLLEGNLVRFIPALAGLDYHLYDRWECFLHVGSYCDYASNLMDPPYHFWFWYAPTTGFEDNPKIPHEFALQQNYPNPFNSYTTIVFSLSENDNVLLEVFDLLGKRIKTLVEGEREPGLHVLRWDGTDVNNDPAPSGVYFYRLTAGDNRDVKRMWLIK